MHCYRETINSRTQIGDKTFNALRYNGFCSIFCELNISKDARNALIDLDALVVPPDQISLQDTNNANSRLSPVICYQRKNGTFVPLIGSKRKGGLTVLKQILDNLNSAYVVPEEGKASTQQSKKNAQIYNKIFDLPSTTAHDKSLHDKIAEIDQSVKIPWHDMTETHTNISNTSRVLETLSKRL